MIKDFFRTLEEQYNIIINIEEKYVSGYEVNYEKIEHIYPHGAMIELTNSCNFNCIHCYGKFGNINRKYMPFQNFKNIINQLVDVNVESIELSGGEITTHPRLYEMTNYLIEKGISKIGLITNGSLLTEPLLKLIENNPERFIIQLDLHGMDDNYLEWFMGVKKYAERNMQMIKKLLILRSIFVLQRL